MEEQKQSANDEYSLPRIGLPMELPEKPTGWTKHMVMHLNFGEAGGSAIYSIKNADGKEMPIQYQYDTRKAGGKGKNRVEPARTGFVIRDQHQPTGFFGEVCSSWNELRAEWSKWMAERAALNKAEGISAKEGA